MEFKECKKMLEQAEKELKDIKLLHEEKEILFKIQKEDEKKYLRKYHAHHKELTNKISSLKKVVETNDWCEKELIKIKKNIGLYELWRYCAIIKNEKDEEDINELFIQNIDRLNSDYINYKKRFDIILNQTTEFY